MLNGENLGQLDVEALERARFQGKKIGLVQGSWDQFHFGHLRYIKKAKESCDYLVIGVDSDAKIRKRKGKNRPLIPENERYIMIKELGISKVGSYEEGKNLADDIVIKDVDEPKWGLIKQVRPDVLITITENYSIEEYNQLIEICGSILVLPRQAETSTSDKLRKKLIANMADKVENFQSRLDMAIQETIAKSGLKEVDGEQFVGMVEHLNNSTDWVTPTVACANVNGKWYYGANQCDYTISRSDLNNRTELFYSTVEHAEINLLKRICDIGQTDTVYVSLFPCDKCMKTLIDKGIKKIYYFEDHPEKNWSKRSHELAEKKGVELICLLEEKEEIQGDIEDYSQCKYTYPPNARHPQQLGIMMDDEYNDVDPLDPNILTNEVVFTTDWWNVTKNKFPYEGAEYHFLLSAMKPVYSVDDIPKEMWEDLKEVWIKLMVEYNIDGGSLNFRFGDCGFSGASLKRIHAHIIKPYEGKKVRFSIGGQKSLKRELRINNRGNY